MVRGFKTIFIQLFVLFMFFSNNLIFRFINFLPLFQAQLPRFRLIRWLPIVKPVQCMETPWWAPLNTPGAATGPVVSRYQASFILYINGKYGLLRRSASSSCQGLWHLAKAFFCSLGKIIFCCYCFFLFFFKF